ncbi:MAG TPA: hypothetical protein VKA46_22160 [Gemmataceae bacterium]|nr:hypothetical protein [Gemmataceae bacterium]
MKFPTWCAGLALLLAPVPLAAQTAPSPPSQEAARADLARLIHKAIVSKLPPAYEDRSGWGHTVPLPDRLRLPRARRTLVQVGDRLEVPDGPWRKVRLRVDNPERDLRVRVTSFKRLDPMTYRVVFEADALLRAEADVQRWRNGLLFADLTAGADVALNVRLEFDVAALIDAGRAPRMRLEPEMRDLQLNLKEFTPRQVSFRRAGVTLAGEGVEAAGAELKESLQGVLRSLEPDLKTRAGEALARAVRERRELLPAGELLKAVAPLLKGEERSPERGPAARQD